MSKSATPAPVLLREKGSKATVPFGAEHAARLLAYPSTRWEEVDAEADPKPAAAVGRKAASAAAASPDATGHPTEV